MTAGRLAKPRWYLPVLLAVDAGVTAASVLLVFGRVDQPHPVRYAAVAASAWVGVQALRRRYRLFELGESRGALPVLHDWLILVAVLAVLSVATARTPQPYAALLALTPALVCTLIARRAVHRHLTAVRRAAEAVDRVLVVGEPGALEGAVRRAGLRHRPSLRRGGHRRRRRRPAGGPRPDGTGRARARRPPGRGPGRRGGAARGLRPLARRRRGAAGTGPPAHRRPAARAVLGAARRGPGGRVGARPRGDLREAADGRVRGGPHRAAGWSGRAPVASTRS